MARLSLEELDFCRTYVRENRWQTAKSGPPHQYNIRTWAETDRSKFDRFVRIIRKCGIPEKFYRHTRIYLHLDGQKYWTMGDLLTNTVVINRDRADRFYGRQDAPLIEPDFSNTVYDEIGAVYDDRYVTPEAVAEDRALFSALEPHCHGTILDIGAGTGIALRYLPVTPDRYYGIEPSQGMVNEFVRQHDRYPIEQTTLENFTMAHSFHLVMGLYGVGSYLDPTSYQRACNLSAPDGMTVLMFYKPGYLPDIHLSDEHAGVHRPSAETIREHLPELIEWHNFWIASNKPLEVSNV